MRLFDASRGTIPFCFDLLIELAPHFIACLMKELLVLDGAMYRRFWMKLFSQRHERNENLGEADKDGEYDEDEDEEQQEDEDPVISGVVTGHTICSSTDKPAQADNTLLTWELDSSMPKAMTKALYWKIVDGSNPAVISEFSPEEFEELNAMSASIFKRGGSEKENLEPSAERCLQILDKLDWKQLKFFGNLVKIKGIQGAVQEVRKLSKGFEKKFDHDQEDDVGYIFELLRYAYEWIKKSIPQRHNSERDVDVFVKTPIFSCLDSVADQHFGEMIMLKDNIWIGCSRVMIFQMSLGSLKISTEYLHETFAAKICFFLFFIRTILVVYIGAGFYASIQRSEFNIPATYDQLGYIVKIVQKNALLGNIEAGPIRRSRESFSLNKFAGGVGHALLVLRILVGKEIAR
ncbi:hypothetical protein G9A89_002578 [Geosiphon pyriformis]|nr:hypothetical protein G9A89_002578 [Geosiphon pyriformis]